MFDEKNSRLTVAAKNLSASTGNLVVKSKIPSVLISGSTNEVDGIGREEKNESKTDLEPDFFDKIRGNLKDRIEDIHRVLLELLIIFLVMGIDLKWQLVNIFINACKKVTRNKKCCVTVSSLTLWQ